MDEVAVAVGVDELRGSAVDVDDDDDDKVDDDTDDADGGKTSVVGVGVVVVVDLMVVPLVCATTRST